jgi:hypothetical protein
MRKFARVIGVAYSGAFVPTQSLPGLQVYLCEAGSRPVEVAPPPSPRKYFTRREIAEWLAERLAEEVPSLVGLAHGFSFPLRYFEAYGLPLDWPAFLDDFQRHWPTDQPHTDTRSVLEGMQGLGNLRMGDPRWRRLTERRAGHRHSLFRFIAPGSMATATHAGLPWLRFLRQKLGKRVHFWPFDGWKVPTGRSVLAEVDPRMWRQAFGPGTGSNAQQDAFAIAAALDCGDRDGDMLARWLEPPLTAHERTVAEIEGWTLGVDTWPETGPEREAEPERAPRPRHQPAGGTLH